MRSDPEPGLWWVLSCPCSSSFSFFFSFSSFFFSLSLPPLAAPQMCPQSQMFGSLQSPNFPDPYPREAQLRWNISVPDGFRVRLYFSHFDLEPSYLCEYDSVKVRRHVRIYPSSAV